MSNTKKRLSVPMNIETFEALKRIGEATNGGIGATAGQYLDGLTPHFVKLAEAFELVKTDPERAVKLLQKAGYEAQQQLTEQQLNLIGDDK